MRVVLAPDKFKGCLTAAEVASAVAGGITDVRSDAEMIMLPVADGGDGTVAAALTAGYTRSSSTPSDRPASLCRPRTRWTATAPSWSLRRWSGWICSPVVSCSR